MVDVSGAPFPASPDRFVSTRRVAWKAPQSFCPARQAVFAYFESTPDRLTPWPSLSSTAEIQSCDLDQLTRVATFQRFPNSRLWMHEAAEQPPPLQASPAPGDLSSMPTMYWFQQQLAPQEQLESSISSRGQAVSAIIQAMLCSIPRIGSLEQPPRPFQNISLQLRDFRIIRAVRE